MKKYILPLIAFFSIIFSNNVFAESYRYDNGFDLTRKKTEINFVTSLNLPSTDTPLTFFPEAVDLGNNCNYTNWKDVWFYSRYGIISQPNPNLNYSNFDRYNGCELSSMNISYGSLFELPQLPRRLDNTINAVRSNVGQDYFQLLQGFRFDITPDNLGDVFSYNGENVSLPIQFNIRFRFRSSSEVSEVINQDINLNNSSEYSSYVSYYDNKTYGLSRREMSCSPQINSTFVPGADYGSGYTETSLDFICSSIMYIDHNGDTSYNFDSRPWYFYLNVEPWIIDVTKLDSLEYDAYLITNNDFTRGRSANLYIQGSDRGDYGDIWGGEVSDFTCQGLDLFGNCIEIPFQNIFSAINPMSPNNFIGQFLNSFADRTDSTCVTLPHLAGWLNMGSAYVCPWFSSEVTNEITPVFTFILSLLVISLLIRWLNKGNGD